MVFEMILRKIGLALAVLALFIFGSCLSANAQCNSRIKAGHACGNSTSTQQLGQDVALSALFDQAFGNTQGTFLLRGSSVWTNAAIANCPDSGGNHLNYTNAGGVTCGTSGGSFTAASKSDQQTGTSNTVAVTPLHQQDHDSAVKASVNFVGATGVINSSFNVTSVTRSATGVYLINFTTAFASTTGYGCIPSTETTVAIAAFCVTLAATKSASVNPLDCLNGSTLALADPAVVNLACYGRQ